MLFLLSFFVFSYSVLPLQQNWRTLWGFSKQAVHSSVCDELALLTASGSDLWGFLVRETLCQLSLSLLRTPHSSEREVGRLTSGEAMCVYVCECAIVNILLFQRHVSGFVYRWDLQYCVRTPGEERGRDGVRQKFSTSWMNVLVAESQI